MLKGKLVSLRNQLTDDSALNDVNSLLWNFMLAEISGNSFVMKNCVNKKSP